MNLWQRLCWNTYTVISVPQAPSLINDKVKFYVRRGKAWRSKTILRGFHYYLTITMICRLESLCKSDSAKVRLRLGNTAATFSLNSSLVPGALFNCHLELALDSSKLGLTKFKSVINKLHCWQMLKTYSSYLKSIKYCVYPLSFAAYSIHKIHPRIASFQR